MVDDGLDDRPTPSRLPHGDVLDVLNEQQQLPPQERALAQRLWWKARQRWSQRREEFDSWLQHNALQPAPAMSRDERRSAFSEWKLVQASSLRERAGAQLGRRSGGHGDGTASAALHATAYAPHPHARRIPERIRIPQPPSGERPPDEAVSAAAATTKNASEWTTTAKNASECVDQPDTYVADMCRKRRFRLTRVRRIRNCADVVRLDVCPRLAHLPPAEHFCCASCVKGIEGLPDEGKGLPDEPQPSPEPDIAPSPEPMPPAASRDMVDEAMHATWHASDMHASEALYRRGLVLGATAPGSTSAEPAPRPYADPGEDTAPAERAAISWTL